jgi:hypothetical protein
VGKVLKKVGSVELNTPNDFFKAIYTELRMKVVDFLLIAYGFLLLTTIIIIFFQGFHCLGFQLPNEFLNWLGGATIGEIGGLLTLTISAVFRKDL